MSAPITAAGHSGGFVVRGFKRLARILPTMAAYLRFGWGGGGGDLRRQIRRHVDHWDLDNAIVNSHQIVPQLMAFGIDRRARILVVGCCNMLELFTFWSFGFHDVVGIDLVSHDRRILSMDMHRMRFPDESFDVLYCAGAFQCSHDPSALATEFARVVKDGGLIAISVPTGYAINDIYRLDVGSLEGLEALFADHAERTLWHQILPEGSPSNPNASVAVRAIFRKKSKRQ